MTPEGRVKAAIKRVLTDMGAYQHWPVQNGMGAPCLDCHGCYRGLYFAIEAKAPGKKPTARQEVTIAAIANAGGIVMVVDSIEEAHEVKGWLEESYEGRYRRSRG